MNGVELLFEGSFKLSQYKSDSSTQRFDMTFSEIVITSAIISNYSDAKDLAKRHGIPLCFGCLVYIKLYYY